MQTFKKIVHASSRYIDILAGLILAGTAGLVVANILMRALFNRPIAGTYELVGYLTAAVIGLSLAHCAVQNSHIAVGFLVDRLPRLTQRFIEVIVNLPSFVFLCLIAWHMVDYANVIALSGRVSSTIQLPFYPFIYLVALGFLMLALVIALRLVESLFGGGSETS